MITKIRKRNGAVVDFQPDRITRAIFKAANAVGGNDWARAAGLTDQVVAIAERQYGDDIADVEGIQDIVEKVLIENGHAKTAKAYILYRENAGAPGKPMPSSALPSRCSATTWGKTIGASRKTPTPKRASTA